MHDVIQGARRGKHVVRDLFAMARDQFQIRLVQAKLSASELAIGTLLALYFSRDHFVVGEGLVAWPGIDTLAKQAMMPKRTVQRAIRELQKRKLFRIIEGGGKQRGNEGRSHRYIAICDAADTAIQRRNASSYHDEMVIRPLNRPLSKRVANRRIEEDRSLEGSSLADFDDFDAYPGPKDTLQ